jgi:predicted nucleic acid-binding protein
VIFADTVYLLALLSPQDQWHERARHISESSRERVVTTGWVLIETGNGLARTANRKMFAQFVRDLQAARDVEIAPATMESFESGLELYEARPDKEWSLTDCISFAVMRERGVTEALTSDHHFEQAGFRVLLKD